MKSACIPSNANNEVFPRFLVPRDHYFYHAFCIVLRLHVFTTFTTCMSKPVCLQFITSLVRKGDGWPMDDDANIHLCDKKLEPIYMY